MEPQPLSTTYPDVFAALNSLYAAIRQALGAQCVGLYVYGSLAHGDFDEKKSDVDAVAVTSGPLEPARVEDLKNMHATLIATGSKWLNVLELTYLPRDDMKKYDRAHPPRVRWHQGRLHTDYWQGDDWVLHRHVLREQGIVVAGPHPRTMIDPVTAPEIHAAVAVGILQNWWEKIVLQKPERLTDAMYQAHAILTMCRALYTLQTGQLASKKASAVWAYAQLDAPYQALVGRAAAWEPGLAMHDYQGAIDFIRYTIATTRDGAPALA